MDIIEQARKERIKRLESQLSKYFIGCSNHENIECPFCHYISKNNRPSGKIFVNDSIRSFKCFCCGIWRRID